jgi:AcrR family transcriptional regulator
METEKDTRQRILNAAVQVFAKKGKAGARMQEIADLAKANKAMIYYYYNSKDNLYEKVLDLVLEEMFREMNRVALTKASPEEKVRQVIDAYVDFYIHRNDSFQLLLREIVSGGEILGRAVLNHKDTFLQNPDILPARIIQEGIDTGAFRPLDSHHTLMSLMGMTIVYALGHPIANGIFGLEDSELPSFVEERRRHIADLLLNGLLVKQNATL